MKSLINKFTLLLTERQSRFCHHSLTDNFIGKLTSHKLIHHLPLVKKILIGCQS